MARPATCSSSGHGHCPEVSVSLFHNLGIDDRGFDFSGFMAFLADPPCDSVCGGVVFVATRHWWRRATYLAKNEVIECALPGQFSRRIVHALLVVGF